MFNKPTFRGRFVEHLRGLWSEERQIVEEENIKLIIDSARLFYLKNIFSSVYETVHTLFKLYVNLGIQI